MKKKKFTGLLICSSLLLGATALVLAGCGGGETHKLTKVNEQAATCTEDGHSAYYTCSHCDKLFADAEAKTETTLETVRINKLGHDVHLVEAKPADCTTAGNIAYYDCSRCDVNFSDEAATQVVETVTQKALGHDMKPVAQVDPIKGTDGKKAHYTCSHEAGVLYADEYGDKTVTEEELKIAALNETIDGTATSDFYNAEKAYVVGASNVKEGGLGFIMNGSLQEDGVYIHIVLNHNLSAAEQVGDHGKIGIIWMIHNEDSLTHPDLGICLSQYGLSELVLDGTLKQHQPYSNNLLKFNTKENDEGASTKFTTTWEFFVSNADLAAMNQGKFAEAFEVKDGKTVLKRGYNVLVNAIANMTAGESQSDKFDDNNGSVCGSMDGGVWYMWRKDGYGDWNNEKVMILTKNGFETSFSRFENTISVKDDSENATVTVAESVEFGSQLQIEITPAQNYFIHKVKLNGKEYDVTKDESTGKYSAEVVIDGTLLKWNENEIVIQAVAVKKVAIGGTLSAKDSAGTAVAANVLNGTLVLKGTYNTFELTVENGAYSGTVYVDEYEVFFYGYARASFTVADENSEIPELRATVAYGSNDKVTVDDTDKTISIAAQAKNSDRNWTGGAEFVLPDNIGTELVFDTTIKMGDIEEGWTSHSTEQRYAIQMTESGKGFYLWSWKNGGSNTFVRELKSLTDCMAEGAVVNGNEAGNGWIYDGLVSATGLNVRVIRIGTRLVLAAEKDGAFVTIGSIECDAGDATRIAVYGVTASYGFTANSVNKLEYVEAVTPSTENEFRGNIEHYTDGTNYYLPDGTVTTLAAVTIAEVAVTFEINATDYDGTTSVTLADGAQIELKGNYKTYTYTVGGAIPEKMIVDTYEAYLYGYGKVSVEVTAEGGKLTIALQKVYAYTSGSAVISEGGTKVTVTGASSADWDANRWAGTAEVAIDGELKAEKYVSFEMTIKSLSEGAFPSQRFVIRVAGENSGFFFWLNGNEGNVRTMIADNLTKMSAEGSHIYSDGPTNYAWMVNAAKGDGLQIRIVRLGDKIIFFAKNGGNMVRVGEIACDANAETNLTFFAGGSTWEYSGISAAVVEHVADGNGKIEHYKVGDVYYSKDGFIVSEAEVTLWDSATLTLSGVAADTEITLVNSLHSVKATIGENGLVTLTGVTGITKGVYTVIAGTAMFEVDFTANSSAEKTLAKVTSADITVSNKEDDNAQVIDMGDAKNSTEYSVTFNLKATTQDAATWQYRFALLLINGNDDTVTGIGSIPIHDGNLIVWSATAADADDKNQTYKNDAISLKFAELVKGANGANVKVTRNGSKVTMYFELDGEWIELYSTTLGDGETNLKFACNNGIEWAISDLTIDYVSASAVTE